MYSQYPYAVCRRGVPAGGSVLYKIVVAQCKALCHKIITLLNDIFIGKVYYLLAYVLIATTKRGKVTVPYFSDNVVL